MDKELNETVLKLKSLLFQKYGEKFNEFYLLNMENQWSGLITSKNSGDENPGKYYTIENECVKLVD